MSDLLLKNGDIVISNNGDISLCEDEFHDITQIANNNIMTRFGDHMYHQELGNKIYNQRIKANLNGMEIVKSECIDAILNGDERVSDVKEMNVTFNNDASCDVDYILILSSDGSEVDGKTSINVFNMNNEDDIPNDDNISDDIEDDYFDNEEYEESDGDK